VKIQAAVAWEAGARLSIEEFDLDDPREDEILVRVEAVGVCHTDDNARLGVVERVGGAVTRVKPGDRVLFTPDY
jgi:Zn-dependent alcohol dehydrogenase